MYNCTYGAFPIEFSCSGGSTTSSHVELSSTSDNLSGTIDLLDIWYYRSKSFLHPILLYSSNNCMLKNDQPLQHLASQGYEYTTLLKALVIWPRCRNGQLEQWKFQENQHLDKFFPLQ